MKIVNKGVEAVNKALEILNCFTEKREELNLTQLSKITGNYKSTTLRLSRSLENYGYLEKEPNGRYKLGPAINKLISVYDDSFNYKELIQAQLEEITRTANETASFFIRQRSNRICVLTSEPHKIIKHTLQIGTLKPVNKGSSGHILSAYHNLKIKNKDAILTNGYSMSFGEIDKEIASVSVPLMSASIKILGALTISGHISNFNKKNSLKFLNILRLSKTKIEKELKKLR